MVLHHAVKIAGDCARADVDVYSFQGDGGTEVWIDIDRTTTALDTVIELIDSSGVVIARSDNSYDEARTTGPAVFDGQSVANELDKSPSISKDRYSTNPRDGGMRIVLPGAVGARSIYHVRVRSGSGDLDAIVDALGPALTRGVWRPARIRAVRNTTR